MRRMHDEAMATIQPRTKSPGSKNNQKHIYVPSFSVITHKIHSYAHAGMYKIEPIYISTSAALKQSITITYVSVYLCFMFMGQKSKR